MNHFLFYSLVSPGYQENAEHSGRGFDGLSRPLRLRQEKAVRSGCLSDNLSYQLNSALFVRPWPLQRGRDNCFGEDENL